MNAKRLLSWLGVKRPYFPRIIIFLIGLIMAVVLAFLDLMLVYGDEPTATPTMDDGRPTDAVTLTPTSSPTITQTPTPTNTLTPTLTLSPTTTNTPTETPTPSQTPTGTIPTSTPTSTPTPTSTSTPEQTETPTLTPTFALPKQCFTQDDLDDIESDAHLRTEIDVLVGLHWPVWEAIQENYKDMTGRYFQGLDSHLGVVPVEGAGTYPSGWFTSPTDQQYQWADFEAFEFDCMSWSMTMDTYDGPEGAGWVACYQSVMSDGSTWEHCINEGPETSRTVNWVELP